MLIFIMIISILISVILFSIPVIYGIFTLLYFAAYYNNIKKENKKKASILLFFNFFNLLWGWLSLGAIFMFFWFITNINADIITTNNTDDITPLVLTIIPFFFVYIVPFINLVLFILKNKKTKNDLMKGGTSYYD